MEIDNLEIRVQSDSRLAITSLNTLIEKLKDVSETLGSINTNALSASAKELTGKLSAINGKWFSDLNKSAKEADRSVSKISETAKRVSKSLYEIQSKYTDLGKGFEIKGSTKQIQKQIDSLTNQLAKAKLAKEDFEASGKTNLGGYETAVKNVIKYTNQIESLKKQLEGIKTEKPQLNISIKGVENAKKYIIEYKKELIDFKSSIKSIMDSIGGISNAPKEIFSVPIKNLKQSIEELKQDFPQATNVISAFENELSNLESIYEKVSKKTVAPKLETGGAKSSKAVGEEVEAIYQKMYGDAEKAGQKTDSLGNRVEALKAKLKELSGQGLNFGDAKFDETYRKLNKASEELKKHKNNLEQAGNSGKSFSEKLKATLANVNSQTTKTSGSMGKLASSIKNALRSVKQSSDGFGGFAKKIGLLYAKIYVLRRGFNALFGTVKKSMDYVETLNYFNSAFGQIAKKADLKSFKEMGYDSAKEYYNSFSERAEQLTQKMSGFKIDESGMAVSTGEKSLGIDPALLMQNQAMFGQMANSMGIASETATNLSSVFTRLGADIASLKNEDFQKVWQNMASGMTGMSRAVDKYGMNIREANLQQTLNNIGISTSISKLTQQEKVLLRTIVMLDSSRAAWGDLAKTMNQPANQLRLLQSNWSNLSRTIGNIFLPIVAKVLPYINAVTIMLQRFAEQIVKFFGFDKKFNWGGLGATGGADFDIDFGDAEDDTAGMADNMDKTAKKAKKAVDNLQGFDIINKLQDPNADKDSDKDKGKGLSPSEVGKLNSALDKLLNDYDKAWNKAFKGMENKANKLANKMQKAIVNAWNKGDFSELGKKVAAWINKGLAKIPWESIKKTVKKTARSIATFLNGFIAGLDWKLIGKTFAEGLNTVIEGVYEFWTTFDWLTFGTSLAEGVTSFIENFDAKKFGKLLGAKFRGMIQFAFGFMTNIPYKNLGKKIGDFINGFLEDMGEVRKNTGLTGWQELGQTISKSITGILDTVNTALSTVKWDEVGKALVQFFINIDWWGIFARLIGVITNALTGTVKLAIAAIAENPAELIKALTGAFAVIFTVKKLTMGLFFLKNSFKSVFTKIANAGLGDANIKSDILTNGSIGKGISNAFKSLGKDSKILGTISKIGKGFGKALSFYIGLNIATSIVGAIGSALKSAGSEKSDKIGEYAAYAIGDSLEFSSGYVQDLISGNFSEVSKKTKKMADAWKGTKAGGDAGESTRKYEKDPVMARVIKKMEEFGYSKNTTKVYSVVKKISEGIKKGTISTSDILHATYKKYDTSTEDKKKKSMADFLDKIGIGEKTKNVSKNGEGYVPLITQTTKYKNSVVSLEKKLKKLGSTETETKNIENTLKNALEKGEISWKDYKKIVDGNYGSVEDLQKAIKKLSPKSVKVKASTEGKKDVDEISGSINSLPIGEYDFFYKATTKGISDVTTMNTAIGKFKNKTISVLISPKLRKNWASYMQKELYKQTFTINTKTTTKGKGEGSKLDSFSKSLKGAVKSQTGESIGYKKLASLLSAVNSTFDEDRRIVIPGYMDYISGEKLANLKGKARTEAINKATEKARKAQKSKGWKELIEYLKKKGIATNNPILFANGGFPQMGQLFIANEAGPELVGNMNGRTTVAPQNDIAEGFAVAITNTLAPVMYAAFKQAATETANTSGGDVYLDGKKITESVIGHVNQISKQRGNSPIWGVN